MRIGIDWGGTKIEAVAMADDGRQMWRERVPTPREDYEGSLRVTVELVARLENETGKTGTVGIGIPGSVVPETQLVKNANSTWLIGKPFKRDLEVALGREIRWANDADCLALSEATDGAGAGKRVVFAAILGTGCGGGIAIDRRVHQGTHGVSGEWGHNPLPWQEAAEYPGELCYCGRQGCIETWLSGPSFEREYLRTSGHALRAVDIGRRAELGELDAVATLSRYVDRLARSLAHVINVLDPDVIVLGGGMSNVSRIYQSLPSVTGSYVFGRLETTPILRARHGDSSGVRGAAWLWR
jgi:fructokinase